MHGDYAIAIIGRTMSASVKAVATSLLSGAAICLFASNGVAVESVAKKPAPFVGIVKSKEIDTSVDAMPRLRVQDGINAEHINKSLAAIDKISKSIVRESSKDETFERKITLPMIGPNFLTVKMHDYTYVAGGPYPNTSNIAITYDLATGIPVDWVSLLGPKIAGKKTVTHEGGFTLGTLSSPRLFDLYKQARGPAVSGDSESDKTACEDIPSDPASDLQVWADTSRGGLMVEALDTVHATQYCGRPILIPVSTLRAEGVSAVLIDSIELGHKQSPGRDKAADEDDDE